MRGSSGRSRRDSRTTWACRSDDVLAASDVPQQKVMQNSAQQVRNAAASLRVAGTCPVGPVLLIDDIVDSRWTLTYAGWLLRTHGAGPVYPFALAAATPQDDA